MAETQNESTSNLYVPTVDDISTRAYRRAGLLNVQQTPTSEQLNAARELLMDLSDKVSALGPFMRQVQYSNITMVEGQNQYLIPEDVVEIVGNGAYVDPTQDQTPFQASSETPVLMKDRDTWQGLNTKSAQSRPTLAYFARNAIESTLFVWPTPSASENGGYIRFQFQRNRPDLTNGSNTMPYERYWTPYFIWALAAVLAVDNSLPMDRVAFLTQEAASNLAIAKNYSKQNVSVRVAINHPTAWGVRRW